MLVIATVNLQKYEIFNTMEFVVEDIDERIKIDGKEFAESFIPSFCITVYEYHNRYDFNRMDKGQLSTLLSSATELEYIHLDTNSTIHVSSRH